MGWLGDGQHALQRDGRPLARLVPNLNVVDDLARDRFLFGSPDEVTEQIVKFNKNLGANHFILGIHWVSMPNNLVLDMMNIMAEEVFPQVEQAL